MIQSWRHRWVRFRRAVHHNPRLPGWLAFTAGSFVVGAALIAATSVGTERSRNALVAAAMAERLERRAIDLADFTQDWAIWDETRDHVQGRNPLFYARNVAPASLASRPLMAVLNGQGQLVSGVVLSANGQRVLPLPPALGHQLLQATAPVGDLRRSSTQMVQLDGEPALVAIQPIRGTGGRGAPVGQLLMLEPIQRYLNPTSSTSRAMGIVEAHVGPAESHRDSGLLGPLMVPVPLAIEAGRTPLKLVISRQAEERRTGLLAIGILAAAEGAFLLAAILLSEASQRQRRYTELRRLRLQRRLDHTAANDSGIDPLTGLLNGPGLVQAIPGQLQRYRDFRHVLVHIDIDRFSQVSNGLGRERSDRVLTALARWLEHNLHPSSLVARVGGDKFGVTLIGMRNSNLHDEVNRLHTQLNQLEFGVDSSFVNLSVSGGARILDINPELPVETQEAAARRALEEAALACDVAKLSHRQTCQFFDTGDGSTQAYLALQERNQQLLGAIRDDQLDLFGQHAWDLDQPDLPANYVELLTRLRDPASGCWSWGEEMVEAANVGGSMGRLDRYVLRLAITRLGAYLRMPEARFIPPEMVFAVNITPDTLLDEGFTEQLLQLLDDHALPAQRLCLEITEQVALRNPVQAERTMERLRCLGVSFAMDDFGTGMTSLGYLRDLPLDYVKIDKSFIRRCQMERSSLLVVEFIVQLGRELGFRTVAEGVETREMLRYVRGLGISMAQGYITTRPIPFCRPSDGWVFAGNGAAALARAEA